MSTPFTLKLTNFEGPFDLLLQLISRHKMDVTEIALSKVTDDFIAHIRASATAEVSEPPRPRVVILPSGVTPWKPGTTAIWPLSTA